MRGRRRAARGVTLMELLIAITLVSMLATGMLFALRVGLGAMDATQRRITQNRLTLGANRVLEQEFGGFLPAMANCGQPMAQAGAAVPFFQGEPAVLRFVSNYSLVEAWRGTPVIVELFVAPSAQGGYRLLMNQYPYRGPVGAGYFCGQAVPGPMGGPPLPAFQSPMQRPSTFVLADRLVRAQFLYKLSLPNLPSQWLPAWRRLDLWPAAVRVEMMPIERDATRVQPMPATFPIYVDKPPMEPNVFY